MYNACSSLSIEMVHISNDHASVLGLRRNPVGSGRKGKVRSTSLCSRGVTTLRIGKTFAWYDGIVSPTTGQKKGSMFFFSTGGASPSTLAPP